MIFLVQLSAVADQVGTNLATFGGTGAEAIYAIIDVLYIGFKTLITLIAVLLIIRSGLRLIYRAVDEQVERSKRVIGGSIAALMLVHLAPVLVKAFYGKLGQEGEAWTGGVGVGVIVLSDELYGLLLWAQVLIATIAILMIVVSGLKAITSYGSEQGVTQLRRTVFGVIAGLLIISLQGAIKETLGLPALGAGLGAPTAIPIITAVIALLNGLLLFSGLLAILVGVYAGIKMVISAGNDEQFNSAKSLLLRVGIGLVVIFSSFALVNLVIGTML